MFLDPIITAFLVIGFGYALQKKIGFDQATVSSILLYLTTPALAFFSLYSRKFVFGEFAVLGLSALAIMGASAIAGLLLLRRIGYRGNGMLLPSMFMNSGYLGFPVTLFALGEIGLQKAILFDSVETITSFTLGIFLVQKKHNHLEKIWEIFRIPLIYAIVLGIFLNLASVQVPGLLLNTLSLVGSATIPLALIALGGRMATLKTGSLKTPLAALFSRFIVGGVTALALVTVFGIHGIVAKVILLIAVMPPAVNSYVLNEKYSNDPENSATAVLIGTLLCVIPIALVLSLP